MELMPNVKRALYKSIFVVVIFSLLLWFSIFLYCVTYYLYIPAIAHTKPVYFQYSALCMSQEVVDPKNTHCPFPSANISLVESGQYQLLSRGQGYTVEVVLEMPESERNKQQGMFMVKLDMLSPKGEVLQSSSRPAVLRYKSWLFSVIYTIFFTPGLLAGSFQEKQVLVLPLYEQYEEHPNHPTQYAHIEIQARYAEIYSSTLRIHAQFTGLRFLMYYWPITSAIFGIFTNFFFVSLMILFSWLRYTMNNNNDNNNDNHEQFNDTDLVEHSLTVANDDTKAGMTSSYQENAGPVVNDSKNIPTSPDSAEITASAPSTEENEALDIEIHHQGCEPLLRRRMVRIGASADDLQPEFLELHRTSPLTSSESDPRENLSSFVLPDSSSSSSAYSESFKDWDQNFTSTTTSSST